jgi:hypothetical protein
MGFPVPRSSKARLKKLERRQRQKARKREAYIATNLPAYLRLLAEQSRLMAELKQAAKTKQQIKKDRDNERSKTEVE